MENRENLNNIILNNRRKGNTTWMLKAVINDDNVIIVGRNANHIQELKAQFKKLLKLVPWYTKVYWFITDSKPCPIFKSIKESFNGYSFPIVFDLHAIQD